MLGLLGGESWNYSFLCCEVARGCWRMSAHKMFRPRYLRPSESELTPNPPSDRTVIVHVNLGLIFLSCGVIDKIRSFILSIWSLVSTHSSISCHSTMKIMIF